MPNQYQIADAYNHKVEEIEHVIAMTDAMRKVIAWNDDLIFSATQIEADDYEVILN